MGGVNLDVTERFGNMALDTTPYEVHDHPKTALRFVIVALLVAMLFVYAAVHPTPNPRAHTLRSVTAHCESPECLSPRQVISANEARRAKRRWAGHTLIVDIRSPDEMADGTAPASDVHVPFMEPSRVKGAPMDFRIDFGNNVDNALRSAHMWHDEPVILVSPSPERSVMAALLLQERGYTRILVVDN
jgi:rhodanese-related sulfurtransferase